MAQYCNITVREMHEFLTPQTFVQIKLPRTAEIVYARRVDTDGKELSLRVYTGIDPSGNSREKGTDAIRVNLFMRIPARGDAPEKIVLVGGSKRVHRVHGWRENLQKRLDSWLDYLPKETCPSCGLLMIRHKSNGGEFLGCVGYPTCKKTLPLPKDKIVTSRERRTYVTSPYRF